MQTFLPYEKFKKSAEVLDDKRLGKQRVECKQILLALGVSIGEHPGNTSSAWRNHPATVMWRGCESSLLLYSIRICDEWIRRGYRDKLRPQFLKAFSQTGFTGWPEWLGDESFHTSHRSNLLRKNESYYSRFSWNVANDKPYVWPSKGDAS